MSNLKRSFSDIIDSGSRIELWVRWTSRFGGYPGILKLMGDVWKIDYNHNTIQFQTIPITDLDTLTDINDSLGNILGERVDVEIIGRLTKFDIQLTSFSVNQLIPNSYDVYFDLTFEYY